MPDRARTARARPAMTAGDGPQNQRPGRVEPLPSRAVAIGGREALAAAPLPAPPAGTPPRTAGARSATSASRLRMLAARSVERERRLVRAFRAGRTPRPRTAGRPASAPRATLPISGLNASKASERAIAELSRRRRLGARARQVTRRLARGRARSRARPRRAGATPSATRRAAVTATTAMTPPAISRPPQLDRRICLAAPRSAPASPSHRSDGVDACSPRKITRRSQVGTPRSLGSGRSCSVVTLTEMLSMSSPANGRSP